MKKLLFFLAIIYSASFACAQTSAYHPMPDSNAVWCEEYYYFDGICDVDYRYALFINGDTTIGGQTYHKLYRTGFVFSSLCGGGSNYFNQFSGLIRQDIYHKRVYTYQSNVDTLLYDFNLSLHDTLLPTFLNNQISNYVCYIDSALIDNNYRKRFWLCSNGDSAYVALIEGVGSTFGLMIAKLFPPFEAGGALNGFSDTVHCNYATAFCGVSVGIQEVEQKETLKFYPNPSTNNLTVECVQKSIIEILNIQGQILMQKQIQQETTEIDISKLAKGVYILRLYSSDKSEVTRFVKE